MRRKIPFVVGMTTFNTEMLKVSVSALGKLHQKFHLIIYNDNPMDIISRRQIRKLGYCGDLTIINTNENVGEFRARLEIINIAKDIKPEWIVFCDDDDLLLDLELPNVSDETFAIIQNAVTLQHRVSDLLRVMENPSNFIVDEENVTLMRPNIGMRGTPVRAKVLFGLVKVLSDLIEELQKVTDKVDFYPPIDAIMWGLTNTYARSTNPNSTPIYMDKINYIKNNLDTSCMKYGKLSKPGRNINEQYNRIVSKCESILQNALNAAAALRG